MWSIGEFSQRVGLSIDTLRYYEKLGLLQPERDTGNRRMFCERDLAWAVFIQRLKSTGMPLAQIIRYADLRSRGPETLQQRLELRRLHRAAVVSKIEALQDDLTNLDGKIGIYERELASRGDFC